MNIPTLAVAEHAGPSSCDVKQLIITGGQGSLARAIAEAFAGSDWQINAPSRLELDVTQREAVEAFFADRAVDLLVCAAGITRDAPLLRHSEKDWDEVMAVNYHGAAACARAALPSMVARQTGHIVFISSHSALQPPLGQSSYAAAKAALLGFADQLAGETGSHGVRVNSILPGFLETRMTESVTATRREQVLADHRLGHFNTPAAVARFIHFLHHELPHTSGQVFQLDSRKAQKT
ncbi:MAG: SDR family oxidoreductase [Verrucomicrobiota bacterium]